MKRLAVYCRYSSDNQREGHSIELQRRSCEDWAKRNGWQVVKHFIDEARSGKDAERRPAFQRMISEAIAPNPPFQGVVVYKSDRFARNREDAIKYKALLRRSGITFFSATEPIGSGDITEVLLESVLDGISEFYSLQLAQRTMAGMAEAARHGWVIGKAPYGYRLAPVKTDRGMKKRLEIEPSKAKWVRRIFELYLTGKGVYAIREELAKTGGRFSQNFILQAIRNEKYCGHMTFGKKMAAGSKHKDFEPVRVKNTHDPIVPEKVWQRANELLEARMPANRSSFVLSDYILSGILKCHCGATMVGQSSHGRSERVRYYRCNAAARLGEKACGQGRINADYLEDLVLAKIKEYLTDPQNIAAVIRSTNRLIERQGVDKAKETASIKSEIARLDAGKANIMKAIEAGHGLELAHVAQRLDEISKTRLDLEGRLADLSRAVDAKPIRNDAEAVAGVVKYFVDLFGSDVMKKKTFCQGLLQAIQLTDAGRGAVIRYNPKLHPDPDKVRLAAESGAHAKELVAQTGECAHALIRWPEQFIILRP